MRHALVVVAAVVATWIGAVGAWLLTRDDTVFGVLVIHSAGFIPLGYWLRGREDRRHERERRRSECGGVDGDTPGRLT